MNFLNFKIYLYFRPYRLRQPAPFNVEKQEFLCPLCECLSNTVLPLIPSLESINTNDESSVKEEQTITFNEWVYGLQAVLKLKVLQFFDFFIFYYKIFLFKYCNFQVLESPVHECNETCSDLHCRVLAEPASTSPPPQFPTTTYYSCHIKQVCIFLCILFLIYKH